jgi:hypothetical protein
MQLSRSEQIVVDHVLILHPATHLTIPALVGEILAGCADFAPEDEFERAIRDLVCAGGLYCERGCVFPSADLLRDEDPALQRMSVLTGQRSSN